MESNNPNLTLTTPLNAPRDSDVIKGRGNGANLHPGNISFRKLVSSQKHAYYMSSNEDKKQIVASIVEIVQSSDPPGRFLVEFKGTWKAMDQKSIYRKVGQALREHQVRLAAKQVKDMNKDTNEPTVKITGPPAIINITPPPKQRTVSLNQNNKRGRDDVICNTQHTHKLPRMGERDIHKDQVQQYQIGVLKEEMVLLRKQISLLSKKVAFLEKNNYDSKKTVGNDRNLSCAASQSTLPKNIPKRSGVRPECINPTPNPSSCQRHVSLGSKPIVQKPYFGQPSLRSFSHALASSFRGISRFDNAEAEDALFAILTEKP